MRLPPTLEIVYSARGEPVKRALLELEQIMKLSSGLIGEYENQKIEELIDYACRNIPFYANHVKKLGIAKGIFLADLPYVEKRLIRQAPEMFLSSRERMSRRSTSGSTGDPFVFFKDRNASAFMDAAMYHAYSWHGVFPGDRQARIWGRATNLKSQIIQMTKDTLLGRKRLSAFAMNDANCLGFFHQLKKFKATHFYAYPNAIYQFALSLERQGICGRELKIPVAICTGELLYPHQREKIKEIFGCKVVNEYGSTENGIIGFECEYERMHLLPTVKVEIINSKKEGVAGEVVVTELNSRSIPFIKYKTGDTGRMVDEDCPCGRPLKRFIIDNGRVDDYIVCPNGTIVYDAILAYLLKSSCRRFKAVQRKIDELEIEMVPWGGEKDNADNIVAQIQNHLGREMAVKISFVSDIPPDPSGKLRYFVSEADFRKQTLAS